MDEPPINSLVDVFSWSYPGTTATNDQRVAAIDLILDRLPDVGWSLVVKLIPGGSIGTTGTMRPRCGILESYPRNLALDKVRLGTRPQLSTAH